MFNWKRILWTSLAPLAMTVCMPVAAEDIDLFVGVDQSSNSASNVLFVLDNGANWASNENDRFCNISDTGEVRTDGSGATSNDTFLNKTSAAIQQCALYSAIKDIKIDVGDSLRIGVIGFNATGVPTYDPATNTIRTDFCTGGNGGCVMMPFTLLNTETKPRILNWIRQLSKANNAGINISTNNRNNGAAMQEAWAYYQGKTGISGRSYATNGSQMNTCGGGNYVIFVGNAYGNNSVPSDQTNDNSPRRPLLGLSSTASMNADPVALDSEKAALTGSVTTSCPRGGTESARTLNLGSLGEGNGVFAIHWAGYMRRQGIKSYAVGITGPDCRPSYPGHLSTLASKGGGKYFESDNFADLKVAFSTILDEITAVNGVFASASLPVSVNTQGTYLNQVFVGMFRPQPDKTPRWMGNLKQYKFKAIQSGGGYDLKLVGADDLSAINSNTGFITQCARSFWGPATKPATDYWSYAGASLGTCTTLDTAGQSDYPDGDVVEKGAAGYRLRLGGQTPATRAVKTCTGTPCTTLADFNTTTSGLSSDLVNWIRGQDVKDENGNSNTTEMRPSVHGDVVHSRPVAVDYGGTTGVVVFYGTNDGMLRAINGNQSGTGAGNELWAFVAPEHASRFARIYDNDVKIDFPSLNNPATQKPYFFDGPVTAHKDGSTVWIFATQRRGGRMVYAFNVSTPASPSIKWRAGCTGSTDASCTSTDFAGIGQTWSSPRVIRTQAEGSTTPLLIFGGGYDTCDDTDNGTTNNSCTAPKGNQVYVLNADTGALVKKFDTLRSVVGDVTVVRNASGLAEYGYAADMGGNVYRIKMTGANTSDWSITRIAALGRNTVPASSTDGASARKFMYGPEVVVVPTRGYNAVLLGSGDREHPLPTNTATAAVQNYFYMLMDKPTVASWLTDESTACGGTGVLCHASLLNIEATSTATVPANLDGKKGWRMQLRSQEQVVTSAVALFGEVTFSTHQPVATSTTSCTNSLGTARVYNVSYLNAAPPPGEERGKTISGGGLPPSPVAGLVTVDKPGGGQMTVPFIIGATPDSPLEVKLKDKSSTASGNKERIYWYIQK
ncbi:MAG: PilC/PilY family type IV pilus protein [Hydrogenophaga sp.]|uniref:pilus assembly protein n=1 Tax=Hydrogenophaga sp. TaxID=1904254 RepID=UPI0027638059|nr:PilC/PilY family type IV pilus protein [Hydrogenophaga sp.]MDP2419569.1 PilC/PilY family type IV pilus protein [Hydrogenophaga sp.]MDZ4187881.1 PilC/PilY family type IV pilus protein [Hydrogenophaga sp.]